MQDVRKFTKATKGNHASMTEGSSFDNLTTDMPSKRDTIPLDESYAPVQATINDSETIESLAKNSKSVDMEEEEELDTIDVFYNYIKNKGVTDDDIKSMQQRILMGEDVNFITTILKDKELILTTRPAWVNELILEELNNFPNISYQMYMDIISKVNLAASLVAFDKHKFEPLTKENYKKRVEMLRELPTFIYDKIVNELVIFDRLIAVATSDKYLETFI